jgi:hypothetical protein
MGGGALEAGWPREAAALLGILGFRWFSLLDTDNAWC